MTSKQLLAVATVSPDSLTLDANNARLHGDKNLSAIKASLEQFGQRRPIVVTHDGVVIAGNGTLEAIRALGWKQVSVTRVPADWTDEQAKAYALADNRTAELATWDLDVLHASVGELEASGWDMDGLGFGELDLDDEPQVVEDDAPPVEDDPVTQVGDLWILGDHRLLCADSTQPDSYETLMRGDQADCIWTDPPYNVAYVGGTKDKLTIVNDRQTDEDFADFLAHSYDRMYENAKPGAAIYVAHSDTGGGVFRRAMVESGFMLKQCLIWVKDSFVLSRQDYHWQHEPILYGWKPGASHSWYGSRKKATVMEEVGDYRQLKKAELVEILQEIADTSTVIHEDKPHRNAEHPTMKPVRLVARMLHNSSKRGDFVLEPFAGSGSTLIASAQMYRNCYAIELDPRYCDVVVKRWEALTGDKAERVTSD